MTISFKKGLTIHLQVLNACCQSKIILKAHLKTHPYTLSFLHLFSKVLSLSWLITAKFYGQTVKHPKLPSSRKSTGSWRLHLLRDFWLTHTLHKLVDACLAKGLEFQKVLVKKRVVLLAKGHVRTLLGHSCGTIPLHCSKTKFSTMGFVWIR